MENEKEDSLISVLQDLRSMLKRQSSLRFALLRGMVYGLGTVIGATVLIAILGWVTGITWDGSNIEQVRDQFNQGLN